jgi:hypothetical protein
MITQTEKDDLEQLIARVGLPALLTILSEIAGEKGDHVRANWQDHVLAACWDRVAGKLDNVAVYVAGEI